MTSFSVRAQCCAFLLMASAAPICAQPSAGNAGPPRNADTVTVGLGVGVTTSYLGAADYRLIPGGALLGSVSGHDFQLNGLQIFVDAIPNGWKGKWAFELGPVAGVRLDRTGSVSDARVGALGELNAAAELGLKGSIGRRGILSRSDQLAVSITGVADVAKAHQSTVITPALQYSFLPSRSSFMQVSLSAEFVGDRFAKYYFGISPAAASVSGLAPYDPNGGLASLGSSVFATRSLSGKRTGWALFGILSYRRLQGDLSRSSIVRQTGSSNQVFASAGLAYTF